MTLAEISPLPQETEEQFLWRLGTAKDSGVLAANWEEIGEKMNKTWRFGKDEYRCSGAYRKKYQDAKAFVGSVLLVKDDPQEGNDIASVMAEMLKERQRLRDERTRYMQVLRRDARVEQKLDEIEINIKSRAQERYDWEAEEREEPSGKEMLVLLSDWHIGQQVDNEFGYYNTQVAKERLNELLQKIAELREMFCCDVCNVAVMGDMISGLIHTAVRVNNKEDVIEQVMTASSLLADFVASLCKIFVKVNFVSVAGNHSRLDPDKDNAIKDERLDDMIAWYVRKSLEHLSNFKNCPSVDNTVAELGICGNLFYFTHGDKEKMTQQGISKLSFMLGEIPYAVCTGHLHKFEMTDINGVKAIRNGSLCGGGNDHAIEHRLCGNASQTVLICGENGIEGVFPVEFL